MVSEITVQVGKRTDQYITLPITVLDRLNKLIIDGQLLEFRKTVPGTEVLMRCLERRRSKADAWSYVFDQESRRVFRTVNEGITTVERV